MAITTLKCKKKPIAQTCLSNKLVRQHLRFLQDLTTAFPVRSLLIGRHKFVLNKKGVPDGTGRLPLHDNKFNDDEKKNAIGVASAENALLEIKRVRPGFIFTDTDMGGMTGFELSRRIKRPAFFS